MLFEGDLLLFLGVDGAVGELGKGVEIMLVQHLKVAGVKAIQLQQDDDQQLQNVFH